MAFAIVQDVPASWERYELSRAALTAPVTGLILHAAGPTAEGYRIIEIWESEEACRRFLDDRLTPAATAAAHGPSVIRELRPEHVVFGHREENGQ